MNSAKPVKRRSYDSSRRRAQADETRSAIVRTARDLFIERGYGHTTVADIAGEVGVSVETIYSSVGTKAELLHQAWDITVGGDDEEIVFHERPEVQAIRNEPDLARRFMLHAAFSTRTAQRIAPFQLMVHSASGADPVAAAMLEEMGRQRLIGIGVMAAEAATTGQLSVSEEECRDVVWSMTDGMLWHRLVNERGWTNERFAEWLGRTWVDRLVKGDGLDVGELVEHVEAEAGCGRRGRCVAAAPTARAGRRSAARGRSAVRGAARRAAPRWAGSGGVVGRAWRPDRAADGWSARDAERRDERRGRRGGPGRNGAPRRRADAEGDRIGLDDRHPHTHLVPREATQHRTRDDARQRAQHQRRRIERHRPPGGGPSCDVPAIA